MIVLFYILLYLIIGLGISEFFIPLARQFGTVDKEDEPVFRLVIILCWLPIFIISLIFNRK